VTGLAGLAVLTRAALRRDRVRLPVWLVAIGGLTAGITSSITGLYVTEADRHAQAAFAAGNVVNRAFNGPASGSAIGSLVMVEGFAITAVLVGVLAVQTVVRHTRAEEESGRAELVGSAVVGRHAPLAAALLVATGTAGGVGVVLTAVLAAHGLPPGGAVLAGVALASVGSVLAGVAGVTAQLASTARAAVGAGIAVLGGAFLLRALGDAAGTVEAGGTRLRSAWPAWLSPIGWGQQVRPFADAHLETLLLPLTAIVVLVTAAVVLRARRDLGAGVLPPRPGPASAGPALRRAAGLAWRLQRGAVVAWAVGLTVVGASFGAVGLDVEEVFGDNPQLREVLVVAGGADALLDAYIAFTVGFLAVGASAFPIRLLARARAEEQAGRLEPLLATATSRSRWLTGHVVIAAAATLATSVAIGGGAALAFGVLGGGWSDAVGFLGGALVHVPATLALAGVAVAAIAVVPRIATPLAWASVAANVAFGQFGVLLGLPDAVTALSPSSHVPAVPADPLSATPLLVLGAVAVGATTVGYLAFARRDLAAAA
jgi:ABC-2 type transport system permease protein